MQTTTELREIREALKEARRYVRKDIETTQTLVRLSYDSLSTLLVLSPDWDAFRTRASRIIDNLIVGLEYIQVNPGVLEGYIDGAVFELGLKGE